MPTGRRSLPPLAATVLASAVLLSGPAGAQVQPVPAPPPEQQPAPQPQPSNPQQPGGPQRGPAGNAFGRGRFPGAQGRPGLPGGQQVPGGIPGQPGGLPQRPGQPAGPGSRAQPAAPSGPTGVDYRGQVTNLKQRHNTAVSRLPATIRPLDRQAMAVVEQLPVRAQWGYLMTFDEYASLDAAMQAKLPQLVQKLAQLSDADRKTYVAGIGREFAGRGTSSSSKEAQRITLRLLELTDLSKIPPAPAAGAAPLGVPGAAPLGAPGAPGAAPLGGAPIVPARPGRPR